MARQQAFLSGGIVYLRPLDVDDAVGPYPDWLNDEEVCVGNSHHVFPYTSTEAAVYIQSSRKNESRLVLAIVRKADHVHIGNICLDNIDFLSRTANLNILLGDRSCWGKGYGREAAWLLCNHGFRTLNLNRIACGTLSDNIGMRKLAAYLGMKEEGQRRQARYKLGRYVDVVEFGLLRDEFFQGLEAGGNPAPSSRQEEMAGGNE